MTEIQPAASVVLLRQDANDIDVLMLKRNSKLKFAGGQWVFPGGRVDAHELAQGDDQQAAQLAAVRETAEETGINIEGNELVPFAHWTTPKGLPRRYATWFYATEVQTQDDQVQIDGGEIHDYRWMTATAVLQAQKAGEIEILPPTYVTLTELSQFQKIDAALSFYRQRPLLEVLPKTSFVEQEVHMLYPGDAGYPSGEPLTEGSRHRFIMAETGWRYETR